MECKQNKGLKRNTMDKYYTKKNIVKDCIKIVKKHLNISKEDLIIEPSAGNGSFISEIKKLSDNYRFYDLYPGNKEIIEQDFLELETDNLKDFPKIHIIGNPPFGRQSSLAIKFIKKSCQFCDSIAFILPKSFKKDSLKNKFPLQFHNVFEKELPKDSFLVDNKEHDVPCVFQIWKKMKHNRKKPEKLTPINFTFVNKNENPDISFRRVGVNAGNIDVHIEDKSIQSHYFIKLVSKSKIKKLENIKFSVADNTVGPKSISKQELISKFNPILA